MALSEGIKAIPLVDENDHFLGAVTSDKIEKILDHETKEDLLKLTGIIGSHDDEIDGTALNVIQKQGSVDYYRIILGGTALLHQLIGGFQKVLAAITLSLHHLYP
jgi:magnesium transporter